MGISFKNLSNVLPSQIMSRPFKSIANTIRKEAPNLGKQISDTFVSGKTEFNQFSKQAFPIKVIKEAFSNLGKLFGDLFKSFR